jgi:hypothetical protein
MTEAELVEAVNSSWSLVIDAMGSYMTIVSAYLIAAYLAGEKLTTSQAGIISALFVTMTSLCSVGILVSLKFMWDIRHSKTE